MKMLSQLIKKLGIGGPTIDDSGQHGNLSRLDSSTESEESDASDSEVDNFVF